LFSSGRKLARQLIGERAEITQLDLSEAGGIRTDPDAVQQIHSSVVEAARRMQQDARSFGDWQQSLLPDLVRIADREGMHLVFFRIPQSSLLERASTTPVRLKDADRFRQLAASWGASIVEFPFPVQDNDFPDGLHLRRSQSVPFSKELARHWLRVSATTTPHAAGAASLRSQ
jgi:hypothetical protein